MTKRDETRQLMLDMEAAGQKYVRRHLQEFLDEFRRRAELLTLMAKKGRVRWR